MSKDVNILKEVEQCLENIKKTQVDADIKAQKNLFIKWADEQQKDLDDQIKKFTIEEKKKEILTRLDQLERQEEILTFFDKQQDIANHYQGKGFPVEDPSKMPIEPDEANFKLRFERHFKPYPKYINRTEASLRVSKEKSDQMESLRKIYMNNRNAQTTADTKHVTRKAKF